jgi:hypothetical protein
MTDAIINRKRLQQGCFEVQLTAFMEIKTNVAFSTFGVDIK